MGFSSWNAFQTQINEDKIIKNIDAIKNLKLDQLGYKFVLIDDLWSEKSRDENGNLKVNRTRFPGGFDYLSDYIHTKGQFSNVKIFFDREVLVIDLLLFFSLGLKLTCALFEHY